MTAIPPVLPSFDDEYHAMQERAWNRFERYNRRPRPVPNELSTTQVEVLMAYLQTGNQNDAAAVLGMSRRMLCRHLEAAMSVVGVGNTAQLVYEAAKRGWI